MSKEKVYIVVTHKHQVKRSKNKVAEPQWEVAETLDFVNQLRERHYTTSVAIADYLNEEMVMVGRSGITTFKQFDNYVRGKYAKEMAELDKNYYTQKTVALSEDVEPAELYTDSFGNVRAKTVFDL